MAHGGTSCPKDKNKGSVEEGKEFHSLTERIQCQCHGSKWPRDEGKESERFELVDAAADDRLKSQEAAWLYKKNVHGRGR